MFETLRKQNGITRQDLAVATKRSVNYILKAEQATFPSAPVALVSYYAAQGHDPDVLRSAYWDYQKRKRRSWLTTWTPLDYTAGLPFRQKWTKAEGLKETAQAQGWAVGAFHSQTGFLEKLLVNPTQYAISVGLCLPAAVIYRNETHLKHSSVIKCVMEELVDYVSSGEAVFELDADLDLITLLDNLRRITKEEGGEVTNDTGSTAVSSTAVSSTAA